MENARDLLVANEMIMEDEDRAHVLQTVAMLRAFTNLGFDVTYVWPDFGKRVSLLAETGAHLASRPCLIRRRLPRYLEFLIRLVPMLVGRRRRLFTRSAGVGLLGAWFGHDTVLELHQAPKPTIHTLLRIAGARLKLVAISSRLGAHLETTLRRPPGSLYVSHLAVDTTAFSRALPLPESERPLPESHVVAVHLYYGALEPDRGAALIAAAAAALPNHGFVLVGRTQDSLVSELDLIRPNVRIVGPVPHKQIPALLKSYDSILLPYEPSISTSDWFSSLKLFEILASGTPLVVSAMPTIREVVDESLALLFEPGNPNEFIAALRTVERNAGAQITKAKRAQDRVCREYSWQIRAQGIANLFNMK